MRRCNFAVVCLAVALTLFNNQVAARDNLSVKRPERLKIDPEIKIKIRIPNDFACELVGNVDEGYCYNLGGMDHYPTPSGFPGYRRHIWKSNENFFEKNKYGYSVIFASYEKDNENNLIINEDEFSLIGNLAESFIRIARKFPDLRFKVDFHSSKGDEEAAGRDMSVQHAKAVADVLVAYGVPSSKFETKAFANTRPLKGIPRSDSRNQRIEITVMR